MHESKIKIKIGTCEYYLKWRLGFRSLPELGTNAAK